MHPAPPSRITGSLCHAALLLIAAIVAISPAVAQSVNQPPALTFIPGSSVKLYQVNGDCEWPEWDATIINTPPACKPTASQTETKADVLGDDVPVAFEHNGELIVTFGDTIGAAGYSPWTNAQNSFQWNSHDPIARSTTANAQDGLALNFFLSGNHGLEVLPPPQPDGTPVAMGADDVPSAGVSINGQIYLGITTGTVTVAMGDHDRSNDYSVLTTFDETAGTFTSGRTISALPNGHFARPTFYLAAPGVLGTPPPVSPEPVVVIFGAGPTARNVYLSIIPSTEFWSGTDQNGNSATRYFAGMSQGQPTWSSSEANAVPLLPLDPSNPGIPYVSVLYSQPLALWVMMFESAGTTPSSGMYLTYAPQPWGPWSTPQLVFNACRDKGFGNFMFYYYASADQNDCPGAMPAGVTSAPNSAGPAGPTAGDQTKNVPTTTRGIAYGPALIERFTIVSGHTLKLFYMMSTWNPYAVVLMESDFTITPAPSTGPAATSALPASGSGTGGTFTFTFSDSGGFASLTVLDILINSVLDGRKACYVAFVPGGASAGSVYLVDNAGDAGGPYAGMTLPGSQSVSNGQCTISGAGSSVSSSGNSVTLTLAITFAAGFAGNQVFYLSAQDATGSSGWQVQGTWNVPGSPGNGPAVSGMSPARTSSLGPTAYTFSFADTKGWQDISVANILINGAIDGRHGCYLALVPASSSVLLVDDAGDAGGPYSGMVLPGSGSVSNGQCTISGTGSSVTGTGNTLTLSLAITFSQSFAGEQIFYLSARNNSGQNSGWQAVGTVSVP